MFTKLLSYFLSVIFFGVLVTSSCKKYPDGPLLSFHTKQHRIEGVWDVTYFSINGHDSTEYLKSKNFYGMYDFFHNDDGLQLNYISDAAFSRTGYWDLNGNSKNLQINFKPGNIHPEHLGPYRANSEWEIRRLTEKEMWLKTFYSDGSEYFVKFKLFKNN
jgi:hypothetical protein